MPAADTRKVHCNKCGGERNHRVLCSDDTRWKDDDYGVEGGVKSETLKCAGCDTVVLRAAEWCSEDIDERGRIAPTIRFYPPATFRPKPAWLADLYLQLTGGEDHFYHLLSEIYVALQNDQRALAAMGIRALLEQMMIAKVGDNGSFVKNLGEFEAKGFVSRIQRERLEAILEAGHAAIHRGYKPSTEDLVTLVDIAEGIVQTLYLHGSKVDKLKRTIPARKK
jgi:hypothetical protein